MQCFMPPNIQTNHELLFDHLRAKYNFLRELLSSHGNESQEGYILNEHHLVFFSRRQSALSWYSRFGFWCGWVCFRTQSGRGKEYSITKGLIKCPLQSGISGLVLIQILKLHLSPSATHSVKASKDICLYSNFQRNYFFLSLPPSFIRISGC